MRHRVARICLVLVLGLGAHWGVPEQAVARGEDACPEPNQTFQAACFLGRDSDALGFISTPDDTDAYRIEVLDFNVEAQIELAEAPAPYRIELADWNGGRLASSTTGSLAAVVRLPGVYYVFVDSPTGQFSDAQPYRLLRRLTYPGSKIPDILYSNEFRHGAEPENKIDTGAEYSSDGSKFTIKMLQAGAPGDPKGAISVWGPELTDFTLTIDTRMESQGFAGYNIFFRFNAGNAYVIFVTAERAAALGKVSGGQSQILAIAQPQSLDLSGGVNRTVIRCAGDEIRVWINGEQVFAGGDGDFRGGRFGFGAATVGPPPTVSFDNILATTPTEG